MSGRRMGVEEELLLVDPVTGRAEGVADTVLDMAPEDIEAELQREQVETATSPVTDCARLLEELRVGRAAAARAANGSAVQVAALATAPLEVYPHVSTGRRYQWMEKAFGITVTEQLSCGCHVHTEVESAEEGVAVLDRIGGWLPVLRALSANSPFWQGLDTEYASYRSVVWNRWPSAGPTGPFGGLAQYERTMADMVGSGVVLDDKMVYFDARLNRRYGTVEVRVADVMVDVRDTVLVAALTRALVETEARRWRDGAQPAPQGAELLRLWHWRAAKSGLSGDLVDPRSGRPAPAAAVLAALRTHVSGALADAGDDALVDAGIARVLADGTGADLQRRLAGKADGDLRAVVAEVVRIGGEMPPG